jgi:phage baseplate assembly protein W
MKAINIKFPISDDKRTNRFLDLNRRTKEAISSNLLLLLLTEKGERYYMPDFGTNLLKYIFEPSDNVTVDDIKVELNEVVTKYLPKIFINNVDFDWMEGGQALEMGGSNELNLKINFTYSDDFFSEEGEIELSF